jgi:DNA-binding transcriptional LysR family regulator
LVQDLEALFGSPLFDRLPTGMQPTEFGALILAFARRSLGDLKRLSGDLDHRRSGRHGSFAIGATTDLLPDLVANAMSEMKRRWPALALQLLDASSDAVFRGLMDGRLDLAVGYFRGDPHESEFDYEVIADEALCIVGRSNHPLLCEPRLTVRALEQSAWILHPRVPLLSKIIERSFLRSGAKAPTNVIESNSLTMTMNLLQKSDAVTVLPEWVVREQVRADRLSPLPVEMIDCSIEFGMMARRRDSLSPLVIEFKEMLRPFDNCSERVSRG